MNIFQIDIELAYIKAFMLLFVIIVFIIKMIIFFLNTNNKKIHFIVKIPGFITMMLSCLLVDLIMFNLIDKKFIFIGEILVGVASILIGVSCWAQINIYSDIFIKTEEDYLRLKKYMRFLFIGGLFYIFLVIFIYFAP